MRNWILWATAVVLVAIAVTREAQAEQFNSIEPGFVMLGPSTVADGALWLRSLRSDPPVVHPNCEWQGQGVNVFYLRPGGNPSVDRALAIVVGAKLAGRRVLVQYDENGLVETYPGFGVTQCEIKGVILD